MSSLGKKLSHFGAYTAIFVDQKVAHVEEGVEEFLLFLQSRDRFWDLESVLEVVLVLALLYLLGERENGEEEVLLRWSGACNLNK